MLVITMLMFNRHNFYSVHHFIYYVGMLTFAYLHYTQSTAEANWNVATFVQIWSHTKVLDKF